MNEPTTALCSCCRDPVEVQNGPLPNTLHTRCDCGRSTTYYPGDWMRLPGGGFYQVTADDATEAPDAPEQPRDWYFPFGCGQPHAGHYHKIHGTHDEARRKMFERFGAKWCMQYGSAEAAGVERWNLKEVK